MLLGLRRRFVYGRKFGGEEGEVRHQVNELSFGKSSAKAFRTASQSCSSTAKLELTVFITSYPTALSSRCRRFSMAPTLSRTGKCNFISASRADLSECSKPF